MPPVTLIFSAHTFAFSEPSPFILSVDPPQRDISPLVIILAALILRAAPPATKRPVSEFLS